jgi:hypothetical protein
VTLDVDMVAGVAFLFAERFNERDPRISPDRGSRRYSADFSKI